MRPAFHFAGTVRPCQRTPESAIRPPDLPGLPGSWTRRPGRLRRARLRGGPGGVRGAALIDEFTSAQFTGPDLFIGKPTTWGLGLQLEPDGTWGMGGLGGNAAWADPARGHAIAYVTRRLGDFERVSALDRAISSALPLS